MNFVKPKLLTVSRLTGPFVVKIGSHISQSETDPHFSRAHFFSFLHIYSPPSK